MTLNFPLKRISEKSATSTIQCSSAQLCRRQSFSDVGAVLRDQFAVERELDDVIRELGEAMVKAAAAGDRVGARLYLERQSAAMRNRTPQHQARLDAQDRIRADELAFNGLWTNEVAGRFDVSAQAVRRRTAC